MKKLKQITALIGVIVLVALYISTLVIALKGGENSGRLLAASIYATVVLPVLLWAYTFIYKLIQQHVDLDKKKEAIEKAKMKQAADSVKTAEKESASDISGEKSESNVSKEE